MKLISTSRRAARDLLPLISFVVTTAKHWDTVVLKVVDKTSFQFTSGIARRYTDGSLEVTITLPRSHGYPCATKHVEEVGYVPVHNWREEFVLVLAHELRHIDQFRCGIPKEPHDREVDAEEFAVEVLNGYRATSKLSINDSIEIEEMSWFRRLWARIQSWTS